MLLSRLILEWCSIEELSRSGGDVCIVDADVFGEDAFNFIKNKISAGENEDFPVISSNETKYFSCSKGSLEVGGLKLYITLIKVPHLSRFKIDASYLSHNVNVASTLEGATKGYGCIFLTF